MGDASNVEDSDGDLQSAYQVAREANIRANIEELRALGLIDVEDLKITDSGSCSSSSRPAATKRTRAPKPRQEPTRTSRRQQKLTPEGVPQPDNVLADKGEYDSDEYETNAEQLYRVTMERKIARLKALHESKHTGYKNPTATYEHTWKRVRTMNDKALARRVVVIEKAVGQHCIVKMRMFSEILILAGKKDLAQQASDALGRLKKLIADESNKCPEQKES